MQQSTRFVTFNTGSPSSKYEYQRTSAMLRNIRSTKDLYLLCGKKPIVSLTYEKDFKTKNQLTLHKICVTSLLCGPWADLWPFYMGCTVNGFLSIKSFTKVGDSSEAARPIHRRKTAVNSLQRLQSPPNST